MTSSSAPPRHRLAVAALCLLSVAVHLVVLYLPGDDVPAVGFEMPGLDKLIHVLTFGIPTALGMAWARSSWPALVLLVHAPVSELVQGALGTGRTGDLTDLLADVVGVGLAWWLMRRRAAGLA